jgi:hypothetical protein
MHLFINKKLKGYKKNKYITSYKINMFEMIDKLFFIFIYCELISIFRKLNI